MEIDMLLYISHVKYLPIVQGLRWKLSHCWIFAVIELHQHQYIVITLPCQDTVNMWGSVFSTDCQQSINQPYFNSQDQT